MEQHRQLTDQVFEQQFASCTLPQELFTHEAHIRLAWLHIKKYGEAFAVENICTQLTNFVEALGAKDKYNKTLTIAAIKAVNHFINKQEINDFNLFIETFPRLKYNFRELLAQHYAVDIFKSTAAKKEYLEPDLLPFT